MLQGPSGLPGIDGQKGEQGQQGVPGFPGGHINSRKAGGCRSSYVRKNMSFSSLNSQNHLFQTQLLGTKGITGNSGFKGELGDRGFPGEKGNKRGATLAMFFRISVCGKPITAYKKMAVFQATSAPLVPLVIIPLLKETLAFLEAQAYLDPRDQLGFLDQKAYKVA